MIIATAEAAARVAGAALLTTGMAVTGTATSGTHGMGAARATSGSGHTGAAQVRTDADAGTGAVTGTGTDAVTGTETGMAAPAPPGHDPAEIAALIARRLGSRTAGPYVDRRGRPVVTVTRSEDAATVRALGVTPRPVPRSAAVLARVTGRLDRQVRISGTAWSVDPASAQIVVEADSTVTGPRLAAVRAAVDGQGRAARLRRIPGRLSLRIAGGDTILGGRRRCSLGFNVRRGPRYYFLTAGHCTRRAVHWRTGRGAVLGRRVGTSFPGNDYGIVRITHRTIRKLGGIRLYNGGYADISRAGTPVAGMRVRRSGSASRVRGGRITGVNTVVNYPQGRVSGLIRATVCSEPGDSGGPLYRGKVALGLTSGGTGDCRSGGVTYFQPVREVLNRYRVKIY